MKFLWKGKAHRKTETEAVRFGLRFLYFTAGREITLYASTKRYLKSFSRGLRSELLDYGVSVTVLCPGAVATNLYNLSDNLKTLAIRLGIMMRPEKLAKKGINALFHHRASLLPGLFNKICTPLVMLLPHGLVRWIMRTTKLVKLDR